MEHTFARRAALISAAAGSSLLVLLVTAGLLGFFAEHPAKTSLAMRVDASRTEFFVRSRDAAFFTQMLDAAGVAPMQLPEGDRYEFALLKSGSGMAWVLYAHRTAEEKHVTLVSENNPDLFLPVGRTGKALGRTKLLRSFIGTQDTEYLWAIPSRLPADGSAAGMVKTMLLQDASEVLLVRDAPGRGRLIVAAPHPQAYVPADPLLSVSPPEAALAVGHPEAAMALISDGLLQSDPALHEGITGILQHLTWKVAGTTDLRSLAQSFARGPMTVMLGRTAENGAAVALRGTSPSERSVEELLMTSLASAHAGMEREIVFRENIRRDIAAATGALSLVRTRHAGWTVLSTASGSGIHAAVSGRKYILSSDIGFLIRILDDRPKAQSDAAVLRGAVNLPWLLDQMERTAPDLLPGFEAGLTTYLGPAAVHVSWSVKPSTAGWVADWTVARSLSPAGTLAN